MRLTSKGRYAVARMLDLTKHSNGNPVRLQEISDRQNISLHYLEQLFKKASKRTGQRQKCTWARRWICSRKKHGPNLHQRHP